MPTYYRPTERHGKRVVYKSTNPAEARRDFLLGKAKLIIMTALLFIVIPLIVADASLSSR